MVLLVGGLEPAQDLDRVVDRRLVDVDFLEPAHQCAILLKVRAVFLVGGRADGPQLAPGQRRLKQVRGVHGPAGRRTRTDYGVDFVDEQNGAVKGVDFLDHGLEAFLEITAVSRPGQQCAHIQRENGRILQDIGYVAVDDLLGQPFGDGCLTDAGVTDVKRVVLGATAQHLDGALDLKVAADQRVDLALARAGVEVAAVFVQRLGAALACRFVLILVRTAHTAAFGQVLVLGDSVGDELHCVQPRHTPLLQKINGEAFPLLKQRDQHVGPCGLPPARALHVQDGALEGPLERHGRPRVRTVVADQIIELIAQESLNRLRQLIDIDVAGPQHFLRVRVFEQGKQKVLQRAELVVQFSGGGQGPAEGFFKL